MYWTAEGGAAHCLPRLIAQSLDAVVTVLPPVNGSEDDLVSILESWLQSGETPEAAGGAGGLPGPALWAEVIRVMKPGAHAVVAAPPAQQDLVVTALRLAGFEIRDRILRLFDDAEGKDVAESPSGLSPLLETLVLARRPLAGTVAENILQHGVGGLNIDGCRVPSPEGRPLREGDYKETNNNTYAGRMDGSLAGGSKAVGTTDLGRWPANLVHDGSAAVLAAFPDAPGQMAPISATAPSEKTSHVYGRMRREGEASAESKNKGAVGFNMKPGLRRMDSGSAARFFYCAPAEPEASARGEYPESLLRYLCRLVTPPQGVVLDPFMRQGAVGCAALAEDFSFMGVESNPGRLAMARAYLANVFADKRYPSDAGYSPFPLHR